MKAILPLLCAFVLLFSVGCADDSTPEEPISYPIHDYSLGDSWTWKETPEYRLQIIRSKEELAAYVTPSDHLPADIDFTENTLLLVAGTAPNIIFEIVKQLSLKDNLLTFLIDLDMGDVNLPAIDNWRVACFVPAIPREQPVQFDLYYKYGDYKRQKIDWTDF